jgi:hypothetical protein
MLIKRGPLKTFLFFLGFSSVIWVFVQFSKEYSVALEFPIIYTNIPKDKILLGDNPRTLDLRVKEKGFVIAKHKFSPPEILIDISDAQEKEGELIFDLDKHKPAILSQLNIEYEDANFLQNDLKITFEEREVKTVKVRSNINLNYAVGYSALEEIKLKPDSVRVSGPENILDTLSFIPTEFLEINNISNDVSGKIKLDYSKLKKITVFQEEVSYSSRTDKFTEGKVQIPIKVINVPANTNVVIFPKEVTVYYQVSLHEFDGITADDFEVNIDYKNASESDGYLLAQISKQPELVNNVRLNKKKIQFVIKR